MTDEVLVDMLRGFSGREPFRPFVIELVSGDRLLVRHPESVRRYIEFRDGPARSVVWYSYVAPDETNRIFDSASVCQLFDAPAG